MIFNYSVRVADKDFFIHKVPHDMDMSEEFLKDFRTLRGIIWYLIELLPYIPEDLQAAWFETEVSMLKSGIRSAKRLLDTFDDLVSCEWH